MWSRSRRYTAGAALLAVVVFGATCGVSKPRGEGAAGAGGGIAQGTGGGIAQGAGGIAQGTGGGIAQGAAGESGSAVDASAAAGGAGAGGSSGGATAGTSGAGGGKALNELSVTCGSTVCSNGSYCIHDSPGGDTTTLHDRDLCVPYPVSCASSSICACLCPEPFVATSQIPGCSATGGAASCWCQIDSQGGGAKVECTGI